MKAHVFAATSLLAILAFATPALADEQAPRASASAENEASNDIVVTARRSEERLQDVPVAVTALGGGTLNSLGIRQVIDIRQAVAGLNISASAGRPSTPIYAIRGQRAGDTQISQDPPVAVYMDDAIVAPVAGSNLGLFDLQNVQVLKGPQGTLFGRNTTGGAVLFVTAKPTRKLEGSLRLGYGSQNTKTVTGVLNVPVNDAVRLRAAVDWTKSDGFGRVVAGPTTYAGGPGFAILSTNPNDPRYGGGPAFPAFTSASVGARTGSRDELNFRLTAAIDPTPWLQTMTTAYYSRAHNGTSAFRILDTPNPNGFAGFFFGTPTAAFPDGNGTKAGPIYNAVARTRARSVYDIETGTTDPGTRIKIYGVIHTDTITLSDSLQFKNIFSYRNTYNYDSIDYDGTNLPLLDTHNLTKTKVYSEEAQLQGKAFDDRLSFTLGAYYYKMTGSDGSGFDGTPPTVALGGASLQYANLVNSSFSAYLQATYKLNETTNLTGGFRYTTDTRKANIIAGQSGAWIPTAPYFTTCAFQNNAGVPFPVSSCQVANSKPFSEPSWLISIDHKLSDDTLVYLSSRHSYRSGGFNIRSNTVIDASASFNPEKVTDLEIGLKSTNRLGGDVTLTTNVAAYYQWYSDIQRSVSTFRNGAAGNVVQNAAKAHIYGGEAEIDLRFGGLVDINLNYALVKPVYDSYPTLAPVLGVPAQPVDYSSKDQVYIPRHQINARVTVSPDIGNAGKLNLIASAYYQSHFFISEDQQNRADLIGRILPVMATTLPTDTVFGQDGYALVNLRAELNEIGGSGLSAAFWVKNLFDKRYIDSGIVFQDSLGLDLGIEGNPRTFGAELTYKF